jgi:hypothetical protein
LAAIGAPMLSLLALTLPAAPAHAQDQAAIEKLVQMNKKALEDYDTLEWDAAKRTLLEALVAGKKSGLENHPVMARTYIHLGAVYITGFKDRQKGIQSFVRALEIDPSIRITRAMATADLNDAFAEATRQSGVGGGRTAAPPAAAPPPSARRRGPIMEDEAESAPSPSRRREPPPEDDESGEPDLPLKINALDCPNPDEFPPNKSVTLRCALAPNLPVAKVFILYREPAKTEFTETEMTKTPKGWFQGKIPKKAASGKSITFYFEGRNAAGKPVVSNGRVESPNLIMFIDKEAAARAIAAAPRSQRRDTEENPLEEREVSGPKRYLGTVDESIIGLDVRYGKRKWWIGIGGGTGYGYATGKMEAISMSPDPSFRALQGDFAPGLAWAGPGHFAPEVGYQITPDFAVSIEGRFQFIPVPPAYSKYSAHGANSVLAKFLMFTKQEKLRFFGSAMAGGGEGFRFTLNPTHDDPKYGTFIGDFQDTIRGGPVLAGVGGGMYYEMSKPVSLVLEVNGLAGFPNFSVVADANLALQINIY